MDVANSFAEIISIDKLKNTNDMQGIGDKFSTSNAVLFCGKVYVIILVASNTRDKAIILQQRLLNLWSYSILSSENLIE